MRPLAGVSVCMDCDSTDLLDRLEGNAHRSLSEAHVMHSANFAELQVIASILHPLHELAAGAQGRGDGHLLGGPTNGAAHQKCAR